MKMAVFFRFFFVSFLWHFHEKQLSEVKLQQKWSSLVQGLHSVEIRKTGAGKQWSLHAPLKCVLMLGLQCVSWRYSISPLVFREVVWIIRIELVALKIQVFSMSCRPVHSCCHVRGNLFNHFWSLYITCGEFDFAFFFFTCNLCYG